MEHNKLQETQIFFIFLIASTYLHTIGYIYTESINQYTVVLYISENFTGRPCFLHRILDKKVFSREGKKKNNKIKMKFTGNAGR